MRLAPILNTLSREPLSHNTVVVLTSDHGEMLGEHGFAGHIYLYEENLLVPLIIASDKLNATGTSVSQQVRLIDIVPTVLELADLGAGGRLDGQSLVPLISGKTEEIDRQAWSYIATSNRGLSLTMPSFKYILNDTTWSPINQTVQYFDLNAPQGEYEEGKCPEDLGTELLSLATSRILKNMSGVRLRFTNNLTEPIIGILSGPPITTSRV